MRGQRLTNASRGDPRGSVNRSNPRFFGYRGDSSRNRQTRSDTSFQPHNISQEEATSPPTDGNPYSRIPSLKPRETQDQRPWTSIPARGYSSSKQRPWTSITARGSSSRGVAPTTNSSSAPYRGFGTGVVPFRSLQATQDAPDVSKEMLQNDYTFGRSRPIQRSFSDEEEELRGDFKKEQEESPEDAAAMKALLSAVDFTGPISEDEEEMKRTGLEENHPNRPSNYFEEGDGYKKGKRCFDPTLVTWEHDTAGCNVIFEEATAIERFGDEGIKKVNREHEEMMKRANEEHMDIDEGEFFPKQEQNEVVLYLDMKVLEDLDRTMYRHSCNLILFLLKSNDNYFDRYRAVLTRTNFVKDNSREMTRIRVCIPENQTLEGILYGHRPKGYFIFAPNLIDIYYMKKACEYFQTGGAVIRNDKRHDDKLMRLQSANPPVFTQLITGVESNECYDSGLDSEGIRDVVDRLDLGVAQQECLRAIHNKYVAAVQGPPGTGKTRTAATFILMHLLLRTRRKMLICCSSHAAVNVLMTMVLKLWNEMLAREYFEGIDLSPESGRLVRLMGKDRSRPLPQELEPYVQDVLSEEKSAKLKEKHKKIKPWERTEAMQAKMKREEYAASIEGICNYSSAIFSTCSTAVSGRLKHCSFNILLLDEAGTIPSILALIPLSRGCDQLLLFGDHKQLPGITAVKGYEESIIEGIIKNNNSIFLLRIQYRMHRAIGSFIDERFYEGKLEHAGVDVDFPSSHIFPGLNQEFPLMILHTSYPENGDQKGGRENKGQANVALDVVKTIRAAEPPGGRIHSIGLLSPYRLQLSYIKDQLNLEGINGVKVVHAGTVDSAQGAEFDIVVLLSVRANAYKALGFLDDPRRCNVAVSRAKKVFILICDLMTISLDAHWMRLIEYVDQHHGVLMGYNPEGIKTLNAQEYMNSMDRFVVQVRGVSFKHTSTDVKNYIFKNSGVTPRSVTLIPSIPEDFKVYEDEKHWYFRGGDSGKYKVELSSHGEVQSVIVDCYRRKIEGSDRRIEICRMDLLSDLDRVSRAFASVEDCRTVLVRGFFWNEPERHETARLRMLLSDEGIRVIGMKRIMVPIPDSEEKKIFNKKETRYLLTCATPKEAKDLVTKDGVEFQSYHDPSSRKTYKMTLFVPRLKTT